MTKAQTLRQQVLGLVASGAAESRADIARRLHAPPSTVSGIVQALLDGGFLAEIGTVASTGGRPQRRLSVPAGDGIVLAVEVGGAHLRLGCLTVAGTLLDVQDLEFDVTQGPDMGLAALAVAVNAVLAASAGSRLLGIGVALPGPVDVTAGWLDSPARMPGWHHAPIRETLARQFGVPIVIENDANALAYGYTANSGHQNVIAVKAGSAIGAGMTVRGSLYRGASGVAGDFSHNRIDAAGQMPCTCGKSGCLETVASGAAVVRLLNSSGVTVRDTAELVSFAHDGHPDVANALRVAGEQVGGALAPVVTFTNPDAVCLGGALSSVEPFVAAVRSQLYQSCHALATKVLTIDAPAPGRDAILLGIARCATEAALAKGFRPLVRQ